MGVPVVSAQGLGALAASAAARTPSRGAHESVPKEAVPEAPEQLKPPLGQPAQPEPIRITESTELRLRVDKETSRIVAQIVDENHEVVRQIPPEEALKIAARTRRLLGLLFDQNA